MLRLCHNAAPLKSVFDVLKDLVTDVNFIFNAKGFKIVAVDPEKIVALCFHMQHPYEYEFTAESPDLFFGINIPTFSKILKGSDAQHTVELVIHSDTPNVMKVKVEHLTKDTISTTSLYGLSLPKDEFGLPFRTYEMTASLPTKDFARTIKDLSHGTKHITISSTSKPNDEPQFLRFSTEGDVYSYTTSVSICPSEDGLQWKSFDAEEVHGKYMIKYIEKFLKAQVGPRIEISINKDSVMLLSYANFSLGTFNMTIAPLELVTV